jgi:hypothetical protein
MDYYVIRILLGFWAKILNYRIFNRYSLFNLEKFFINLISTIRGKPNPAFKMFGVWNGLLCHNNSYINCAQKTKLSKIKLRFAILFGKILY